MTATDRRGLSAGWSALIAAVLAGLSYVLARYIGLGPSVGPWAYWPIQGLLCGFFYRRPYRQWPLIAVAAAFGQCVAIYIIRGDLAGGATIGGAIGGVTQAMLAPWILRAFGATTGPLSRPRDFAWFVAVAVCLVPLAITPLTALIYSRGLSLSFQTAWWTLFVGNSLSMLLFAPMTMQSGWSLRRLSWRIMAEPLACQLAIVLLAVITFGGLGGWSQYVVLPYAMFPLLVWSAVRCGPQLTSVAIVNVATIAAWSTARGFGPFASGSLPLEELVLRLQVYLAFVALTALVLSSFAERLRWVVTETTRTTAQLRALAMKIESVQESERAAIARDVHDEVGQSLSVLRMDASRLSAIVAPSAEATALVADMSTAIDSALAEVRAIATALHPSALDDLGVGSAIEMHVSQVARRTGLRATIDVAELTKRVDRGREGVIYRVLQESLTNVVRHAEAESVAVQLVETETTVELTVTDDGRGIDAIVLERSGSLGLLGMQERAAAFGGTIAIGAAESGGTEVRLRLPLVQ